MLRMRLRRTGAKNQPRYRVVIANARAPRDGAFVESIGFYDPLTEPATIRIDPERARYWLAKGVQPSEPVQRLLRRAGIVEDSATRRGAPAPTRAAAAASSSSETSAGAPAYAASEPSPAPKEREDAGDA